MAGSQSVKSNIRSKTYTNILWLSHEIFHSKQNPSWILPHNEFRTQTAKHYHNSEAVKILPVGAQMMVFLPLRAGWASSF